MSYTPKWIDKYQARVFVLISITIIIGFLAVLFIFGEKPINWEEFEENTYSLALGAGGIASAFIILTLLVVHEKSYWGNGQDAYVFIVLGALVTLIAAIMELLNIFKSVLPV